MILYSDLLFLQNSIRHNLSLYDIFAREKPCRSQGKSGSSYWTLRSDVPLKPTKAIHSLLASSSRASSNAVHGKLINATQCTMVLLNLKFI